MSGRWIVAVLVVALSGCSTGGMGRTAAESTTGTPRPVPSVATPAVAPSDTPTARSTSRFDSIGVIGHSGATGTLTDPQNYQRLANENSWATGDNPKIQSIYTRLLATRPAMLGHNYNAAVGGSGVDNLTEQIDQLVRSSRILPDLVLVQTIDNDMRCDGTDGTNYRPFGAELDQALSKIDRTMPGAQVFFVSQWASVALWTNWAQHVPSQVADNSGTGPCDVFDEEGRPRPAGIASMQRIVDEYWAEVVRACGRHPGCATDGGAPQREFVPRDADLSIDKNHLSAQGHAKYAAIIWESLPEAIKRAP